MGEVSSQGELIATLTFTFSRLSLSVSPQGERESSSALLYTTAELADRRLIYELVITTLIAATARERSSLVIYEVR